ncbi:MAG: hypothetical protein MJE68_20070, partial [Proteobacteria bacterium]|nr:hypothetical protein [Pseudomonadota bacterium]
DCEVCAFPLPEMAIVDKQIHDAIHAVREQQGKPVTRRFFKEQREIASNKLQCMTQLRKTSTPNPPSVSNAFPPRRPRARSDLTNGTPTGSNSENTDQANTSHSKERFLAIKRRFESASSSDEDIKRQRTSSQQ